MSGRVDVAVVGAPFLDLSFVGLSKLPDPGEEIVAERLGVTPGGTAIQAIGAARLGLRAALVAPRPTDPLGALLVDLVEREGIRWSGPPGDSASITALLPSERGVAMATVLGSTEPAASDVEETGARAVVASLGRAALVPRDARYYATTGSLEVGDGLARLGGALRRAHAAIVNEAEARALTGLDAAGAVAAILELGAATCVVTLGARGAVAGDAAGVLEVPAPRVDALDATGAGDLFVATYVWADAAGLALRARLEWATLAAALSVRETTALDGAPTLEDLLSEGERRGFTAP